MNKPLQTDRDVDTLMSCICIVGCILLFLFS